MREFLRRAHEQPAEKEDVALAVAMWSEYVGVKLSQRPGFQGISGPKLVVHPDDSEEMPQTLKLSLVEVMAPELSGLGELVQAQSPHVYVEGATSSVGVPIAPDPGGRKPEMRLDSAFGTYAWKHMIKPDTFLLHVYSANDLDEYGGTYEYMRELELLIVASGERNLYALTLEKNTRQFNPNPLREHYKFSPRIRNALNGHGIIRTSVRPSSLSEIAIVTNGLRFVTGALLQNVSPALV